jgi:hypothetical protein
MIGDYTYLRHAVMPVLEGNRAVFIAYSLEKVFQ